MEREEGEAEVIVAFSSCLCYSINRQIPINLLCDLYAQLPVTITELVKIHEHVLIQMDAGLLTHEHSKLLYTGSCEQEVHWKIVAVCQVSDIYSSERMLIIRIGCVHGVKVPNSNYNLES